MKKSCFLFIFALIAIISTLDLFSQSKTDTCSVFDSAIIYYLDSILGNDTEKTFLVDSTTPFVRGLNGSGLDDTIYLYLNIPKEDKLKIYEFSSEYRIKAKIRAYLPLYVAKHRNITLIKQQELDEIFLNWDEVGIMRNEKNCCWNEIRDKLGHIGFINMSRPFFFDDGRKAIITFGYSWGGLSGAIYNFMFIKQNGSWKIFYAQVLSVS